MEDSIELCSCEEANQLRSVLERLIIDCKDARCSAMNTGEPPSTRIASIERILSRAIDRAEDNIP